MSALFFAPSCPSGGNFYVCTTGVLFVGCCTLNPCNDDGCNSSNLRPASFDPKKYGTFADQACWGNSSVGWYTCTGTNPPFMGCCATNPCRGGAGCPFQNLVAGKLSSNSASAADFLGFTNSSSSSTATSGRLSASINSTTALSATSSSISISKTSYSSSATTAPAISSLASPSVTSTAALVAARPALNSMTGVIVGSLLGGIMFLALIIGLSMLWIRRRTSRSRLSLIMNRANHAEPANKGMAAENASPTAVVSKSDPWQAVYPDSNNPSHSTPYSPDSLGSLSYIISEMGTAPANALSSNPRPRDSASSYVQPFPTPDPAHPMNTGSGLPVSPTTPTTPSPHHIPPSGSPPLSELPLNEHRSSTMIETPGVQSNPSAARQAQRAIRSSQQEPGEPSWELSSTNSVRRGARDADADLSDSPAAPAPLTYNQEVPSHPQPPRTTQPPGART